LGNDNEDHPLAKKISWEYNREGGKYNDKMRLVIDGDLNKLKTAQRYWLWGAAGCLFLMAGLGQIYESLMDEYGFIDALVYVDWKLAGFGGALTLFGFTGILAFVQNWGRVTFDKTKGVWWRGSYSKNNDTIGTIKDIEAVQIVNEWVISTKEKKTSKGNYITVDDSHTSFELNLVLNDGSRKTLQDSRFIDLVEKNAAEIGKYLGVPIFRKG